MLEGLKNRVGEQRLEEDHVGLCGHDKEFYIKPNEKPSKDIKLAMAMIHLVFRLFLVLNRDYMRVEHVVMGRSYRRVR